MGEPAAAVLPRVAPVSTSDAAGWPLVVAAGVGAVAGGWQGWVVHSGLADDAYITLGAARDLAVHGCWCVTPGLLSNTATSPLWTALLAVPMLAVSPVAALAVLLGLLTGVTSLLVTLTARRFGWAWWAGPLVAAGLATSPVMQSAVGLESALAVCLLAALVFVAGADCPVWAGVVCGALALTRPDLAVVGVLVAVWWWRRAHLVVGAAVVTVLPWELVSLRLFGSLIPDTLIWKQGQPGLGYKTIGDGWPLLLAHYPAATVLALALLAAGGLAGVWWCWMAPRHPVTLLAAAGAVHVVALCALGVGAGFMWYLAPATGCAVMVLAFTAARAPLEALWLPLAGLIAAGLVFTAGHSWATQGNPWMANGALPAQYAAVAARVPTGATVETVHGEVGSIAFFGGDRIRVVDPLSDPGRMAPYVEQRLAQSPWLRLLYPAWQPSLPAPAQWQTRYAPSGTATWSGYGGWSHIAVIAR